MKRKLLVLLMVLCVLMLTGCKLKMTTGLIIDKNGDVTAEIVSAMDDEYIDMSIQAQENADNSSEEDNEDKIEDTEEIEESEEVEETEQKTYTDEERWAFLERNDENGDEYKDYKRVRYEDGEFKGFKYSRKLGSLDNLTKDGTISSFSFDELTEQNFIFTKSGNKYNLHFSSNDSEETEQAEQMSENGGTMVFEFYVTLPEKAVKNNATRVSDDGLTYTWDLLKDRDIDITFTYGKASLPIVPIIIVAIAVIAIIAVSVKKKNTPNTTANYDIPSDDAPTDNSNSEQ